MLYISAVQSDRLEEEAVSESADQGASVKMQEMDEMAVWLHGTFQNSTLGSTCETINGQIIMRIVMGLQRKQD